MIFLWCLLWHPRNSPFHACVPPFEAYKMDQSGWWIWAQGGFMVGLWLIYGWFMFPSHMSAKPQVSSSYLPCYKEFDWSTSRNALHLHLLPPFRLCWKQTYSEAGIILRLAPLPSKCCIIARWTLQKGNVSWDLLNVCFQLFSILKQEANSGCELQILPVPMNQHLTISAKSAACAVQLQSAKESPCATILGLQKHLHTVFISVHQSSSVFQIDLRESSRIFQNLPSSRFLKLRRF